MQERDRLLKALLKRPGLLKPEEIANIVEDALHWLTNAATNNDFKMRLLNNLTRAVSDPQLLERIRQQAEALGLD